MLTARTAIKPITVHRAGADRMLDDAADGERAAVPAPVKSKAQAPTCGRS